jgi:Arc/MetJ-type ribon-helix-helix transcriptional regulator
MNGIRNVRLPEDLCAKAEEKFAGKFTNVEELLQFLLRELLDDQAEALDEAEQLVIEKRLRDLGYI